MRREDIEKKELVIGIYSRKSLFTGKGESIEAQINYAKEYVYARKNKFDSEFRFVIYQDEGYSGKNLNRPDFQRLMNDIYNRKIDYLICYRLDRISRNVGDFASLISELSNFGVSFISVKEEFDTSTPMGRAMMYIASVFAQLERETIAERVKDSYYELARRGRWLGGILPVGFDSLQQEQVVLEGKVKKSFVLQNIETECDHVAMLGEKFLEMASFNAVAKYLKQNGIQSKAGKLYSPSAIRDILTNPVYCVADYDAYTFLMEIGAECCFEEKDFTGQYGLIAYRKRDQSLKSKQRLEMSEWLFAIGQHKGIFSGKTWVRIIRLIEEKKQPRKRTNINNQNDYSLLSGMLVCTECGGPMYCYKYNPETGRFYYICKNKNDALTDIKCKSKNLPGAVVDQMVIEALLDYDAPGSMLAQQIDHMYQALGDSGPDKQIAKLERNITQAKNEIDNFASLLCKDGINDLLFQTINDKSNALSKSIEQWEVELKILKESGKSLKEERANIDSMILSLAKLKNHVGRMTLPEKREIVRKLIDHINWDGENLDIFIYG